MGGMGTGLHFGMAMVGLGIGRFIGYGSRVCGI